MHDQRQRGERDKAIVMWPGMKLGAGPGSDHELFLEMQVVLRKCYYSLCFQGTLQKGQPETCNRETFLLP